MRPEATMSGERHYIFLLPPFPGRRNFLLRVYRLSCFRVREPALGCPSTTHSPERSPCPIAT